MLKIIITRDASHRLHPAINAEISGEPCCEQIKERLEFPDYPWEMLLCFFDYDVDAKTHICVWCGKPTIWQEIFKNGGEKNGRND